MKIWHFATPLQLFFVLNLPTIQIGHSITCTLGLKFNALVKAWKNDYIFWLIWIMNTKDNELSLSHSHAAQFKGADWLISNSAKFSYREGGAALQLYSTQCCLEWGRTTWFSKLTRKSARAVSSYDSRTIWHQDNLTPRTIWHRSNFPFLPMVSNCPRRQIVLVSSCPVSNCARCQIVPNLWPPVLPTRWCLEQVRTMWFSKNIFNGCL